MEGPEQLCGLLLVQGAEIEYPVRQVFRSAVLLLDQGWFGFGPVRGSRAARRADDDDGQRCQSPSYVPEHVGAGRVGPLEVVEEYDDGPVRGGVREEGEGGARHREPFGRRPVAYAQRALQGVPLPGGQGPGVAEQWPEHLVQGGEREPRLRLRAGHPQDAEPGAPGSGLGHPEQRALPRAGVAPQDDRRSRGSDVRQGRPDGGDLRVPPRQGRLGPPPLGYLRTAHDLGRPASPCSVSLSCHRPRTGPPPAQ